MLAPEEGRGRKILERRDLVNIGGADADHVEWRGGVSKGGG